MLNRLGIVDNPQSKLMNTTQLTTQSIRGRTNGVGIYLYLFTLLLLGYYGVGNC